MRELGVSRQNVSSPRSQVLLAGARASGFAGDLWTLARVAQVIEQHTGVAHHPEHVWRLLRGLGWSVQRPARGATERDDEAVERWVKEDWPRIKKGQPGARQRSSSGMSPGSR
jgi:transposase